MMECWNNSNNETIAVEEELKNQERGEKADQMPRLWRMWGFARKYSAVIGPWKSFFVSYPSHVLIMAICRMFDVLALVHSNGFRESKIPPAGRHLRRL